MLPVQFTFWGIYWLECILSCPHISPIHIYTYHTMIGFGCYATLTLVVESSRNCRWNVQVSGVLLVLLLLLPPRLLCSLSLARLLATPQFSKMTSWNTHWNTQKKRNTTLQYTWCLCWMETLSNMINMWVDCHKLATSRTRVSQKKSQKNCATSLDIPKSLGSDLKQTMDRPHTLLESTQISQINPFLIHPMGSGIMAPSVAPERSPHSVS